MFISQKVQAGGLPIAFNANEYALKYATMSLASVRLDDLWMVLSASEEGAHPAVEIVVEEKQKAGGTANKEWVHWLDGIRDMTPILDIHKKIRRLVREEAAEPG